MHSSDLVAIANFTGHSTGTAQHLPPLPTCMRAREREKHIDNIVQVSCEGSQLQRLMPPPFHPTSHLYLKFTKLQPCDSVVK